MFGRLGVSLHRATPDVDRPQPVDTARQVGELARKYGHVAVVGDGVQDSTALAAASVGVVMGVAGDDASVKAADVAVMGNDPETLVHAVRLARRTQRVTNQGLMISALVIVALVVGVLRNALSLPIAVLGQEASALVVIVNGLRLLLP